jgi:hypothetical protein
LPRGSSATVIASVIVSLAATASRRRTRRARMRSEAREPLAALTAGVRRLALVGLAKNTGKTETLATLLREHASAGVTVGVTSIGRDGEAHDVIDARISKPRVLLEAGSLVASTRELLSASGLEHERLLNTGVRTPLGEVAVARLSERGAVEIAGPSAAADVRAVCETMEQHGAQQVLIDGAIDRRAASSPAIADGLLVATGAVLARDLDELVHATAQAVDVIRLPLAEQPPADHAVAVEREVALRGEPARVAKLLREHPQASTLTVDGALGEGFLDALLAARAERAGRELEIVISDPTHAFLSRRGPRWYAKAGVAIAVRETIALRAITVNPVAPMSHSFDSAELCERIAGVIGDVPVLDVRASGYPAAAAPPSPRL